MTKLSFGGIPHDDAKRNMRLFANRVLPGLQQDRAFTTPPTPATVAQPATKADVFAPA
jgi:hypothetical protein